MKIATILIAASLIAPTAGAAFAYSDNHPADGVVAPYAPRFLPNGETAPAPARRANGGVGGQEIPFDNAQTRSGGPSGGNITQTGG